MMAQFASIVLAVALASTMLYAASSKLATPWNLKKTLDGMGLGQFAWHLTGAITSLEAGIGVATAVAVPPLAVAVPAIILLGLFAIAGIWARVARLSVSCNCFGAGHSRLGLKTAGRAGLLAILYAAYAALPPTTSLQQWVAPAVVLIILVCGTFAWLRAVSRPAMMGV